MQNQILNTVNEIFIERDRHRKIKIYTISTLLVIGYCFMVYLLMTMPNTETPHVSMPSVMPSPPGSAPSGNKLPSIQLRQTSTPFRNINSTLGVSMPTSHTSGGRFTMTIHTVSSSRPVSIGGGGSGNGGGSTAGSNTANRTHIVSQYYSASMPSIAHALHMPTTSSMVESTQERLQKHNLNAENTLASMQGVIESNSPQRTIARAKKNGWDDYGQDEEPFPDTIGDVTWGWMLILAGMYLIVRVARERKQVRDARASELKDLPTLSE